MVGNIVGEPFKKYVNNQIQVRQQVYGSGFDSTGFSRKQQYLTYLNSRLSWVKMASSVIVNPPRSGERANIQQEIITGTIGDEGINRLSKLGFNNPEAFLGYKLASSAVLFNGLQQATFDDKVNSDGGSIDPTIADKFNKWATRFGYSKTNSIWNQSAYGLGGTDFGLQPMPGITGVEINHLNRGSIKKATITLKAYNKFQFELIDLLYLRLGFNMLLEWGNSHYIESNGEDESGNIIKPQDEIQIGDITTVGATLTEQFWFQSSRDTPKTIHDEFEKYRKKYDSNYDGMIGRVSNFNWNFNPDGSYDITIQLTSLGDVVESFKVNTLANPDSDYIEIDEANISQIELHLYKKRNEIDTILDKNKNYISFYNNTIFQSIKDWFRNEEKIKSEKNETYYIRFGELLRYIQSDILPVFANNDVQYPIVDINFDTQKNVMAIFPNQIAIDPRICIVNTSYFSPPPKDKPFIFGEGLNKFNSEEFDVSHGKIMNVYLNFKFIQGILNNNLDNKGNLSLYNFIKGICDGINKSLGSVNNLEPIVNEETNTLVIIDQTQFEGRDKLRKSLAISGSNLDVKEANKEEKNSFPINIYGYNNISGSASSNFVKSYSFQTEISPNLATTIAIGATANGRVVGEDATAFSQWNKGLTDKFKQSLNPNEITTKSKNREVSNYLKDQENKNKKEQEANAEAAQRNKENEQNIERIQFDYQSESNAAAPTRLIKEYRNYYLPYILGDRMNLKTAETGTIYSLSERYLDFDSTVIDRGYTSFKNYISSLSVEDKKYSTGTLGFLPVNLQIEMDGISGIKIYQKLLVDTSFLPSNYPDVLEFLIKQVNHSIQDNKWVTTLETISVPKIQKIPIIDQLDPDIEFLTTNAPENLVFFSPIDNINIKSFIRTEPTNTTVGNFGVGRDSEVGVHRGIDLSYKDVIRAPISGIPTITKANNTSKTSGIKIEGIGEYTNYTVYIFYINPTNFITPGKPITRGTRIGLPQDLSVDYGKNVTDHIHFEIRFVNNEGKTYWIDPTNLNYINTVTSAEGFDLLSNQFRNN